MTNRVPDRRRRPPSRRAAAFVAVAALAFAGRADAWQLYERGGFRVELSGSLRELAQAGKQTDADDFAQAGLEAAAAGDLRCVFAATFADCAAFEEVGEEDAFQSLTRLRTRLDVEIVPGLRGVVVYDHELLAGELDTLEADLGQGLVQDDLFDADWSIVDSSRAEWRHIFYRGYLQLEAGSLDLAVGRQRIAWGVGRLWNPIDRFNAIPPLAVQGDQSPGVDSIDARWSFDGFSYAELVYAPGGSRDEARYALMLHGVVWDTDVSLMGGMFEKAPTVGMDLARNVGDAAARFELVYTRPEQEVWRIGNRRPRAPNDYVQLVASVDYTFDVADGIYVLVEHLYNGNDLGFGSGRAGPLLGLFEATNERPAGLPDTVQGPFPTGASSAIFGGSRVLSFAENQTGVLVGGDITPELRLDFLSIYDWDGQSAAFFPSLKYSPGGALEVTAGVQTFTGGRRSQYGDAETFIYLLVDFFF